MKYKNIFLFMFKQKSEITDADLSLLVKRKADKI